MVKGLEETCCKEHVRILGLSSLERTKLRGNFIAPYRLLRRESGEGGAGDRSPVPSTDRMYGNGSKLHQVRAFLLKRR